VTDLYRYTPSRTAAYAYLALFSLSGFAHLIMMFPLSAAFFVPLVLGCASKSQLSRLGVFFKLLKLILIHDSVEAGGYYCRAWSAADTHKILPFVASGLLILAAPPMLAATAYMNFGRMIRNLKADACSLISPRWLTKLFILGDVICLASQLAGSVLRASDDLQTNQNGARIILAGLILQVAMFSFFGILAVTFHVRFSRLAEMELAWSRETRRCLIRPEHSVCGDEYHSYHRFWRERGWVYCYA